MKIKEIKVYQVDLPFTREYKLSGGRVWRSLDSTVVSLETESGLTGWGESCPWGSNYVVGFAEGVRAGLGVLASHLIGVNGHEIELVNHIMDHQLLGHFYLKSAIDLACWDLLGKKADLPVYQLLGGRFNDTFDIIVVLPNDSPDAMLELANQYRDLGYRRLSCKITGNISMDVEIIQKILTSTRDGETVLVDANKGYNVSDALRLIEQTRKFDYVLEQPCATYEECAQIAKRTSRSISLDEALDGVGIIFRVLADKSAEMMNIKIGKFGGITKSKKIIDVCREAGISVTIQQDGGSNIANAAIIHLAMATPPKFLHSAWDSREFLNVTTADGNPKIKDGKNSAPDTPGLGIEPRKEILGKPIAVYR